MINNPIPSIGDSYEFDFGIPDVFKIWDEDHFSLAITTSHPNFNGYYNSSDYYNFSRILAIINKKSGKVVDLIGRRPSFYLNYSNIPNFDHFSYEVLKDDVLINFYADSLIYSLNKNTKIVTKKFGVSGINMNLDYVLTNTYEDAHKRWRKDQFEVGHYHYIKYLKNRNLLLRGYSRGINDINDGLQFYKEGCLIADIDVPKGLKIIGDVNGQLFAENLDTNKEKLELYKVNLIYEK